MYNKFYVLKSNMFKNWYVLVSLLYFLQPCSGKFEEATSNHTVRISALEINRKYPILQAGHFVAKYERTLLLFLLCDYGYGLYAFPRHLNQVSL
jgi:hypothetical protein